MGRAYLVIIILGALIGAMLPSGPRPVRPEPLAAAASQAGSTPRRTLVLPPDAGQASGAAAPSGPWTTLERGPGGHYFADAQVNGMTIHFLVDTGASGVALTTADAQRVGLQFSPGEFTAVGRGASGDVRGKLVTLDRVSLNGRTVEGVAGAIIEGGDISLLGQSFLTRMGSIEMNGERMVIR